MARPPRPPRTVKAALTRFIIAAIVLLGLTMCLLVGDPALKVLFGCFAVGAFLFTLLYGIDIGKAINREPTSKRSLQVVGAILVFPLAIFGLIIIAGGMVGVFVSVKTVEMQLCTGKLSIDATVALMRLLVCFLMPLAGYVMVREGLRRDPAVTKDIQRGSGRLSVIVASLWFRILMATQGIAIGTLVLAFATAAVATNDCQAAAWIWSPMVSLSVVVIAAVIAAGIFALRRRRVARRA